MSKSKLPKNPPICEISAAGCSEPVCFYDDKGLLLWAFLNWKNDTTLGSMVFCALPGNKQVGSVKFTKNGVLKIKLEKTAPVFNVFTVNEHLEKKREYPSIIDLNEKGNGNKDGHGLEEPTEPGSILRRDKP